MPTESAFILAGLLVLVAVGAWAFGQFLDRDPALPTRISADYLRGLSLVLSRKTDEALELFIQMAKVDEDTLETHFALGHLFRRRGEFERAIRVHENLLARENLNDAQRDQAMYALAEDYLGAGLFDRAEELLQQLRDSETQRQAALEKLVYIYEREAEWEKAIDVHRRLEMQTGQKTPHVAHYYCELAQAALAAGDMRSAREYLQHTIRSPSGALRGVLIRAHLAKEEGRNREAAALYQQVLETDRAFVSEVLADLLACFENEGRGMEFEEYLRSRLAADASLGTELAYAAILHQLTRSPILANTIEHYIASSDVLSRLVDGASMRSDKPGERMATLDRVTSGLRMLALSNARYRCGNCGYGTHKFIWQCPGCKLWETIRPLQRFQLETAVG
jgi:lipopolysaccharide biosynthesis regulator YciM